MRLSHLRLAGMVCEVTLVESTAWPEWAVADIELAKTALSRMQARGGQSSELACLLALE